MKKKIHKVREREKNIKDVNEKYVEINVSCKCIFRRQKCCDFNSHEFIASPKSNKK